MSSAATHGRFTPGSCCALAAVCLAAACSAGAFESAAAPQAPDGGLGSIADPFPDAAAESDAGVAPPFSDGGSAVQVRLFHGIVNLGELYLCHDPARANLDAGAVQPSVLPVAGNFGDVGSYMALDARSAGVLTVHRTHVPSDAGIPGDGGEPDAGPCGEDSLEAALTLTEALAAPGYPSDDAGVTPAYPALAGSGSFTVFASGAALDPARLSAHLDEVRSEFLSAHPGDQAGADQAVRSEETRLRSGKGPVLGIYPERFLGSEQTFQLSLAHLVPDAPAIAGGEGSGPVRLCVTVGTLESEVIPAAPEFGVGFRERRVLSTELAVGEMYRFRVFAAEAFDQSGQDCATTSLMPLAQLDEEAERFMAGRAYTLAFAGALTPGALCTPVAEDSVLRSGCAAPVEELGPRLVLLDEAR